MIVFKRNSTPFNPYPASVKPQGAILTAMSAYTALHSLRRQILGGPNKTCYTVSTYSVTGIKTHLPISDFLLFRCPA